MSSVLLEQLIREVTSLRREVEALKTAEIIPSRLQASDGDPNPALSADASGAITSVINIRPGDMSATGLDYRSTTLAIDQKWVMARDQGLGLGLLVCYSASETSSCLVLVDSSNGPQIVLSTPAGRYTNVYDNAGTFNFYHGSGALKLQNKRGGARSMSVGYFTIA